jgi:OOP family OmpA-OmpF porin
MSWKLPKGIEMNKLQKLFVATAIIFIGTLTTNVYAESFVGVSLGAASYPDFVTSDTTSVVNAVAAANPGTPIFGVGVQDKSGSGTKLFGGTWISDNLGAEVGYVDFGKPSETITTTGVATTWKASVTASAFYGALLGGGKVNDGTRIFGKLGLYSSSATFTVSVVGPGGTAGISQSVSNTGTMLGIGSSFQITQNIGLRLEYESYGKVKINDYSEADIGLLSVGLAYMF